MFGKHKKWIKIFVDGRLSETQKFENGFFSDIENDFTTVEFLFQCAANDFQRPTLHTYIQQSLEAKRPGANPTTFEFTATTSAL
jgi:hypothetical protein